MDPLSLTPVIDTHCHLDFPEFDADRRQVIERARAAGLIAAVNVGSTVENSRGAVALAEAEPFVYACVGVHPHDAEGFGPAELGSLESLCSSRKVVGIGETGLDYFRNLSSPEKQRAVFEAHIDLASRKGLPLVVHSRDAQDDTIAALKAAGARRVLIHCFSGGGKFLTDCLDLGCLVSFTCNITYKKAGMLREMARLAPLDRICVETDAPYLSPEGRRGQRNEPAFAATACGQIATVKGISMEEAAAATTANAKRFFGIE